MRLPFLAVATLASGIAATLTARRVRAWYLRWGATPAEVAASMPLDERIPDPMLNSTMAITIKASPAQIWPWLAQMGDPPRAGYYSYTWIERMVGLQIDNADVILPAHQSLAVGQALDRSGTMVVQAVTPGQLLVLGPPAALADIVACTWAFSLRPLNPGATRLAVRARARWSFARMLRTMPPYTWPFWLLIEPGAFLMEHKMLREIKRLAEAPLAGARSAAQPAVPGLALRSVGRWLRLAATRAVHFRPDRLGPDYAIEQGAPIGTSARPSATTGAPGPGSSSASGFGPTAQIPPCTGRFSASVS